MFASHCRNRFLGCGLIAGALGGLAGCDQSPVPIEHRVLDGSPIRGRQVIAAVDCGVCHRIPGIAGAYGIVGPSLEQFGRRKFIAGTHANQPETLVAWVKNAPSLSPRTAMPDLGLSENQARDVAAYLYSLR